MKGNTHMQESCFNYDFKRQQLQRDLTLVEKTT